MINRRALLTAMFALPVLAASGSLAADSGRGKKEDKRARKAREREEARLALQRGEILSLAQILAIVDRQTAGDVIEVELERKKSGFIYEVKLLTPAGEVRKLKLDAGDGTLLKSELE